MRPAGPQGRRRPSAPPGTRPCSPTGWCSPARTPHWLAANKGQALDALQFLLHEAQGEREESRLAYLDVESFRLFRMKEVIAMAGFAAEKARALGSYTFTSLSPRERRWVHMVLSRQPGFATESEGTGTFKALKVTRV